jgi:hypothetical protein
MERSWRRTAPNSTGSCPLSVRSRGSSCIPRSFEKTPRKQHQALLYTGGLKDEGRDRRLSVPGGRPLLWRAPPAAGTLSPSSPHAVRRSSRGGAEVTKSVGRFRLKVRVVAETASLTPAELVIVSVKALPDIDYQRLLAPVVRPGSTILLLQNGIAMTTACRPVSPGHCPLRACVHLYQPYCAIHGSSTPGTDRSMWAPGYGRTGRGAGDCGALNRAGSNAPSAEYPHLAL